MYRFLTIDKTDFRKKLAIYIDQLAMAGAVTNEIITMLETATVQPPEPPDDVLGEVEKILIELARLHTDDKQEAISKAGLILRRLKRYLKTNDADEVERSCDNCGEEYCCELAKNSLRRNPCDSWREVEQAPPCDCEGKVVLTKDEWNDVIDFAEDKIREYFYDDSEPTGLLPEPLIIKKLVWSYWKKLAETKLAKLEAGDA